LRKFLFIFLAIPSIAFGATVYKNPEEGTILSAEYKASGSGKIVYIVDTVTQLCFVTMKRGGLGLSPSQVPCESLVKRDEWKKFITWLKDDYSQK